MVLSTPFLQFSAGKFERRSTPTESLLIHARGTCAMQSIPERAQFRGGGRGQLRQGRGAALIRCADPLRLVGAGPGQAGMTAAQGRISHSHITRQRTKPCHIRKEKRVDNPTFFFFSLIFRGMAGKIKILWRKGDGGGGIHPPGGERLAPAYIPQPLTPRTPPRRFFEKKWNHGGVNLWLNHSMRNCTEGGTTDDRTL